MNARKEGYPYEDGLWIECPDCGGEGMLNRFEEDPLWYGEDDWFTCEACNGKGGWLEPYELSAAAKPSLPTGEQQS